MNFRNFFPCIILVLILAGLLDTAYLTYEHYSNFVPPCPVHSVLGSFVDCGRVLRSSYSEILGVPLALLGLIYYLFLLLFASAAFLWKKSFQQFLPFVATFGLGFSLYLFYLQVFQIHAICIYCTASGVINLLLFILVCLKRHD